MNHISLYKKAFDTKSTETIPFDIFLENIKNGIWWEYVGAVRSAKTDDQKSAAKKNVPMVTISGTFSTRSDAALIEHSGFLCMDIDNEDPDKVKSILAADDHVYAIFSSISNNGAAVVFNIDGKRHRDAFLAISEYLFETYSLVVDPSCKNESRGRFVSHDPNLYINQSARKWSKYIPKKDITKVKESKTIFVKSDFDQIVKTICDRRLDIAGNYDNWLRIGFGIAEKFGESGREYFHLLSQYRNGRNASTTALIDRQYDACLKANGPGRHATIGSFYFFVKQAGIEIYSTQTKEIIKTAASQKRSAGMDDKAIISNLKEHSDFDHSIIEEIVPQVTTDTYQEDVSLIEEIDNELKTCFELRRNVITRNLEQYKGGKWSRMDTIYVNSIYLQLKKHYDKLSKDLFDIILMSDMTKEYNPFEDFINEHRELAPQGAIRALSDTITSGFGLSPDDRYYFIKKWLIGIISTIHGKHSPLMLVLTGEQQNTGKSEWFRRLLPIELMPYYAESKLDQGKDDEILMTQKLLIVDDEMGGKNKKEIARLKELTSKQTFSLREPYGRSNVDLNRLAVLGGTSNDNGILNDPTGNRRIIPVHVIEIDHKAYNAIDKIEILIEAYHAWVSGETHNLTREDVQKLNKSTDSDFQEVSMEEELVFRYFRTPDYESEGEWFTTSDIITHIDAMTRQKLFPKRVGMFLMKNGVERGVFKRNKMPRYGYKLFKVEMLKNEPMTDTNESEVFDFGFDEDELPF